MTVETDVNPLIYPGDGIVSAFPTPFFALPSDIWATWRPSDGSPSSVLSLDADYSLAGAGSPAGGTLTIIDLSFVPGPSAGTLIVGTNVPTTQRRSFPRGGGIDNKEYEAALDKLTLIGQQIEHQLGAALRAPDDDLAGDMTLPRESDRANGFQGYDADGKPLIYDYAALVSLLKPGIIGDIATRTLPLSREQLGLKGNGVTDDSPLYNLSVDIVSARGGATFFLQPQDGKSFYFKYPIRNKSFVNTISAGPAWKLGAACTISTEGRLAESYGTAPLTLGAAATAGANFLIIETAPQGGAALSSLFAVGDVIIVRGQRDPASNVVEYGEHRITAISDGLRQLTIADTLAYSYAISYADNGYATLFGSPNVTQVTRAVSAALTSDGILGSSFVVIDPARIGQFGIDDWVILSDEALCSDLVTGGSSSRAREEILKVTAIGSEAANSLTFNRRLERAYGTGLHARVTLLDPAIRAGFDGVSATFTEAPSAVVPTFLMKRSVECEIVSPQVANEDAYGSFGPMFKMYQSVNCKYVRPNGRNPKYLGSGNGYGVHLENCTACSVDEPDISGCRYNILHQLTTQCHETMVDLDDDRVAAVAWAANGEVGDTLTVRLISGGSQFASDVTTRRAIRFGGASGKVGPSRCVVTGGRIAQYKGANTACVEFLPGQNECAVRGVQFDDIGTLLYHADNAAAPTLVADTAAIEDFVVNGYSGKLIDVDGQRNGSSTRTLASLTLRGRAYGGSLHGFISHVAMATLLDLAIKAGSVDGTEVYFLKAVDVTRLMVRGGLFRDGGRGFALTNCTGAVLRNDFENMTSTVILQDNGGNTIKWLNNEGLDYTPTLDVPGSTSIAPIVYIGIT